MFHKYDFGTASQISSRHWETEPVERPSVLPLGIGVVAIEICAMAALFLFPFHSMKTFQPGSKHHHLAAQTQDHKMMHGHHFSDVPPHLVGQKIPRA
jgi:hypothetical protein